MVKFCRRIITHTKLSKPFFDFMEQDFIFGVIVVIPRTSKLDATKRDDIVNRKLAKSPKSNDRNENIVLYHIFRWGLLGRNHFGNH